jgi:hypothetical protein
MYLWKTRLLNFNMYMCVWGIYLSCLLDFRLDFVTVPTRRLYLLFCLFCILFLFCFLREFFNMKVYMYPHTEGIACDRILQHDSSYVATYIGHCLLTEFFNTYVHSCWRILSDRKCPIYVATHVFSRWRFLSDRQCPMYVTTYELSCWRIISICCYMNRALSVWQNSSTW